jgi:hypothetical protein
LDPFGLAYFAKRALAHLPWIPVGVNPVDDALNTEMVHEQLFFEDGKSPENIGFFDDGTLKTDPSPKGYHRADGGYDDCLMRQAIARVPLRPYCLLGKPGGIEKFNCQDWAAEVRKEYAKLQNDPNAKEACRDKECGKK